MFLVLSYVLLGVGLYLLYEWFTRKQWVTGIPGKYIFVTGCDTGFGHALVKHLDLLGCNVFAACLTEDGCKELREKCSERLTTIQLDVTDADSVKRAAEIVTSRIPQNEGLWGLVNNAATAGNTAGPFEWHTKKDYQKVLDVNVLGMVDVIQAFLPSLTKSKGRIVNTSSMAGRAVLAGAAPYSVSKFGVEVLSDCLRQDLGHTGIMVSVLEPGGFKTPLMSQKNITRLVQNAWDQLPQEQKDKYDSDCVDTYASDFMKSVAGWMSDDISVVVGAYTHALLAKYPKKRYSVGFTSMFVHIPLSYMPSWIQDAFSHMLIGKIMPRKKQI